MSHGNDDTELAGRGRAFIKAVADLNKGNATVIGEWATASHVERQGARKTKPATGVGNTPNPNP